jgi:hypothetical protein
MNLVIETFQEDCMKMLRKVIEMLNEIVIIRRSVRGQKSEVRSLIDQLDRTQVERFDFVP